MRTTMAAWLAAIAILSVGLTGCMRENRSETIIISDTETEQSPSSDNEPFTVKTLYRVLDGSPNTGEHHGWDDKKGINA